MTIKITTKKLLESFQVLQVLSNMELPPKAGFQIGHAMGQALPIVQTYEKARIATVEQFAKKDADGKAILLPKEGDKPAQYDMEDMAACEAALSDIQSAEIEIAVSPVSVASLGDTKMPAAFFPVLDWLIVNPEQA